MGAWCSAGGPHWNEVDFHHPTLLACILLISMDQLSNNMIYFLQCPTLSRSLWKRAEQQISHLRRRRCLVIWRSQDQRGMRLKLWFHINMSDRSGHVKDIQRRSVYFWCISCQWEHLLAMQRMQRMYKRMYDMNWYDRYLHRKLCAHVRKKVSKQVKHARFPIMQSCPTWARIKIRGILKWMVADWRYDLFWGAQADALVGVVGALYWRHPIM